MHTLTILSTLEEHQRLFTRKLSGFILNESSSEHMLGEQNFAAFVGADLLSAKQNAWKIKKQKDSMNRRLLYFEKLI